MTLRGDDEIVDIKDGDKDVSEKAVAPQMVQGDSPRQCEETTEGKAEPAPTA